MISGHFKNAHQTDWAVLCSVNGVTSLWVFWGDPSTPIKLAEHKNTVMSQQYDDTGRMGFSWGIFRAAPKQILKAQKFPTSLPASLVKHDGIEDAFMQKASTIRYWNKGKWLELDGSD
jgi:hypothetical protein